MKRITTLPRLIKLIDKYPYNTINLFRQYKGEDWRQYVRYPCEIRLSTLTPLYLVGLTDKQRYRIRSPSTIKILEEDHIYSHHPSFSVHYEPYEITQSHITSQNYTSLLVRKHFY
jgi:hypothetical protein